jgi:hypothetical protein
MTIIAAGDKLKKLLQLVLPFLLNNHFFLARVEKDGDKAGVSIYDSFRDSSEYGHQVEYVMRIVRELLPDLAVEEILARCPQQSDENSCGYLVMGLICSFLSGSQNFAEVEFCASDLLPFKMSILSDLQQQQLTLGCALPKTWVAPDRYRPPPKKRARQPCDLRGALIFPLNLALQLRQTDPSSVSQNSGSSILLDFVPVRDEILTEDIRGNNITHSLSEEHIPVVVERSVQTEHILANGKISSGLEKGVSWH